MIFPLKKFNFHFQLIQMRIVFALLLCGVLLGLTLASTTWAHFSLKTAQQILRWNESLTEQLNTKEVELTSTQTLLKDLESQDQIQKNRELQKEIAEIQKTFPASIQTYEDLLEIRAKSKNTAELDKNFARILQLLSEKNYASAAALITLTNTKIKEEEQKIASAFTIPENVPEKNTAPQSGYSRQRVTSNGNTYLVDLIAGDLSSTKVIVDTAAKENCSNDCPTLSLSEYVQRNGAYAGINGSYFCPASYPSCAGKTNSFDTLLMNKDKVYFNSDNNVYSSVPAVIFSNGGVRFVGKSQEWGRDTSIDSMIANQPMLVSGKQSVFGGDGDQKKSSKSNRSFVANQGNIVYIGVVYNSSVAEAAGVLATLGMDNAINLDSGGSTALWSGGYKAGPGRNIPNAILFVRK